MRMISVRLAAVSVVILVLAGPLRSQIPTELPDNYLVFELVCQGKEFGGGAQHFEEYNHHNAAMQAVRDAIEGRFPGWELEHTLMDFNNDPPTRHVDILEVIDQAAEKIAGELAAQR